MSRIDMYFIFIFTFLCTCIPSYSKIYDCFTFFNELELLKVRLEELNDHVDYFVLVEGVETHRGELKPLYFQENRHLFEKYLPKIIHIIITERLSPNQEDPVKGFWDREHLQREHIAKGLKNCEHLDIILISDLDEIPCTEILEKVKKQLIFTKSKNFNSHKKYKKRKHKPEELARSTYNTLAFHMPWFIYQLNRKHNWNNGNEWVGTVATLYGNFKKKGAQFFREYRWHFPRVKKAGWHFTYMGGKDRVRQKLLSIVEGRDDILGITDEEIETWIQEQIAIPIDDTFPKYVIENVEHLKSMGFIAECTP